MSTLDPLPYHRDLLAYLKREEDDLWQWFSSEKFLSGLADNVRLDLLKASYRLDRETHGPLYAQADTALRKLGLEIPITLYQAQASAPANASLSFLPGEAHIVFWGPLLSALTPDETGWVVGHELGHHRLFSGWNGDYLIADQILNAMAGHAQAEPSQVQSFRYFRLYSEICADRGSLAITGDPLSVIAALVKSETGARDVSGREYLRQADEIFAKEKILSRELDHPELFIRARAVKLWADKGPAAEEEIARMIEGPLTLDTIDLLGQRRLADLTRSVVRRFFAPTWTRTTPLLAHARLFFEDFAPDEEGNGLTPAATADASVQDYLSYVLLDLATSDPTLEDKPLATATDVVRELGFADRFTDIAARELKTKRKPARK